LESFGSWLDVSCICDTAPTSPKPLIILTIPSVPASENTPNPHPIKPHPSLATSEKHRPQCHTTRFPLFVPDATPPASNGVAPLLDRVRTKAQWEQLDHNKEALRQLENYLVFHFGRLNDRERLAAGLSIGSGQVEGACKNLIGARLKQTGAKWRRERVDRMGIICSIYYGDQ